VVKMYEAWKSRSWIESCGEKSEAVRQLSQVWRGASWVAVTALLSKAREVKILTSDAIVYGLPWPNGEGEMVAIGELVAV
jgi:hypothetical protein